MVLALWGKGAGELLLGSVTVVFGFSADEFGSGICGCDGSCSDEFGSVGLGCTDGCWFDDGSDPACSYSDRDGPDELGGFVQRLFVLLLLLGLSKGYLFLRGGGMLTG